MKFFFYSIIGIYLFLYFYAVWVYEGFTLVTALSVLVTLGVLGWLLVRGWGGKQPRALAEASADKHAAPAEMRWYQSPFPYLLLLGSVALISFFVL
ncbi:hypothetical protein DRW07_00535 [Alteromonas sediminis]|uniref:Uncharacterized protein n=1 Tax=Alteromonas sediminis TaxID=2259342 RepID=A0A3N5ZA52_9ALTE|nr:hypothetical protein [Alteromonas sediminis]RPJ67934.1 hypothetical protein DRW07_00535 [Alteromonas sediminis]